MTDSPPPSFVPLSLNDTLTRPQGRTLHRSTNVPRPARPSHAHSSSLSSIQGAKDAKLAAAAMCASLGLGHTESPTSSRSDVSEEQEDASTLETPRPRPPLRGISSTSSSSIRGEEEQELSRLRRQLAQLQKEKSELATRAERAERERDSARKAAGGSGNAALDAKQLEELERSFADQERLLSGYQAQSEKDQAEREALKRQLRRLTDFLAKTFGHDWETSLFGSPLSSITSSAASAAALSSPALRSKLGGRQSLLATLSGNLPLRRRISDSLEESSPTKERDSLDQEEEKDGTAAENGSLLTPQALRSHLDAVQTLLRSMEQRIIEREVELQEVEKRAREEARRAKERSGELEELVRRLREDRE